MDIETLKDWLKNSPPSTNPGPDGLNGWDADGVKICAECAGRLLDRGCKLGEKVAPIWDESVTCDVHGGK